MAVESISSLFSENPITTLTDDYMFEVAGDAGAGVVSGATKLSTIREYAAGTFLALSNTGNLSLAKVSGISKFSFDGSVFKFNPPGSEVQFGAATINTSDGNLGTSGATYNIGPLGHLMTNTAILSWSTSGNIFVTPDCSLVRYTTSTIAARNGDNTAFVTFQALSFTGDGSNVTSVPGALTIDTGWWPNGDDGAKGIGLVSSANATAQMVLDGFPAAFSNTALLIAAIVDQVNALRAALRDQKSPNN